MLLGPRRLDSRRIRLLWTLGHWHYALRHHTYKSLLARRLFIDVLPNWADLTRNWITASDDD
jgi:hypothetical protein